MERILVYTLILVVLQVAHSQDTCHNVMNANSWICDSGVMRGEWDFHNPYSAGQSETDVKGQCCVESCFNVMNANDWTCDSGVMRSEGDLHNPYMMGQSETDVKGQCCQESCHNVMNANDWTCDSGVMRGEGDLHNPYMMGQSETDVKGQCCQEVTVIKKLKCGSGMYLANKFTDNERCELCEGGKYSSSSSKRNRRCKKCSKGKYQKERGSSTCTTCPTGFNTKGKRGKRQCFDAISGKSMKKLGIYPYPKGWKSNEK